MNGFFQIWPKIMMEKNEKNGYNFSKGEVCKNLVRLNLFRIQFYITPIEQNFPARTGGYPFRLPKLVVSTIFDQNGRLSPILIIMTRLLSLNFIYKFIFSVYSSISNNIDKKNWATRSRDHFFFVTKLLKSAYFGKIQRK